MRTLGNLALLFFMAIWLVGCESQRTIVNALDEKEANEIIVFLSSKGIAAAKVQSKEGSGAGGGGKIVLWDIAVNQEQSNEAMALLNQVGLPRRRGQNLLGIFTNSGLVPSEMTEQIRYQAGLAEQMASTIRKIDGVLDAEVQVSFPKEDPLNPGKTQGKISASVYVKHNGVLDDPNSHLVTKIKRLVAAGVTGLDYDNVTVIGDRARFNEAPYGISLGSEEDKQYLSVWTIIIAKESLTRFRLLFFSFTVLLLLLLLALIWLVWKFHRIFSELGFKELFQLSPFMAEQKPKEKLEEKKYEEPEDSEEVKEKGVDET